jgi:hypothetical protein
MNTLRTATFARLDRALDEDATRYAHLKAARGRAVGEVALLDREIDDVARTVQALQQSRQELETAYAHADRAGGVYAVHCRVP